MTDTTDNNAALELEAPAVPAEVIAEACHEANRVLQRHQGAEETGVAVSPPWSEDSVDQRAGVLDGVLAAIDGTTPEESHQRWCDRKTADGWTYGPVKDADARTHPCLVDYDDLPPSQRLKDDLFLAIVDALHPRDVELEADLDGRHPAVVDVARFLLEVNPNLPPRLAAVARILKFTTVMALDAVDEDSAELTDALRLFLRGKDSLVRAAIRADEKAAG